MTTDGKISHREKEYVVGRLATRAPSMKIEFMWAMGWPTPADFVAPPLWVKHLILLTYAPKAAKADSPPKPLMTFSGFAEGMNQTVFATLEHPTPDEVAAEERNPLLKKLRLQALQTLQAVQPQQVFDDLPDVLKPKTAEDHLAHSAGRFEAAKFVTDDEPDTITGEMSYFMWVFWPEIETAKSRKELHDWLISMKFVSCSYKLVEKLCRKIGFRSVDEHAEKD